MNEHRLKDFFRENPVYNEESIKSRFGITNEQIYDIFERAFNEKLRGKVISSDSPVLMYVIGQPGAGKTGLVKEIEMEHNNYVCLDVDFFTSFHPRNIDLLRNPNEYIKIIHPMASACCRLAISRCIDQKYNFILETNLRNTDVVKATMERAKAAGYTINASVLIAKSQDSYLGMLYRHYSFLKQGISARRIDDQVHDEGCLAVQNFVFQSLSLGQQIFPISELIIYKRDLSLLGKLYFNQSSFINGELYRRNCLELKNSFCEEILKEPNIEEDIDLKMQKFFVFEGINADSAIIDKDLEVRRIEDKLIFLKNTQRERIQYERERQE